jgi:hypothetical protein
MKTLRSFPLRLIALGEWLMILPAILLMAAATLRLLQPAQYEPAHTSMLIFNWTTTHISRLGAGILFLGMPAVVAMAGCVALWKVWHTDQGLRNDATAVVAILRRRGAVFVLMTATLLGAAVLALVTAHIITD